MHREKSLFGSVTYVLLHAHTIDMAYIEQYLCLILTYKIIMNWFRQERWLKSAGRSGRVYVIATLGS